MRPNTDIDKMMVFFVVPTATSWYQSSPFIGFLASKLLVIFFRKFPGLVKNWDHQNDDFFSNPLTIDVNNNNNNNNKNQVEKITAHVASSQLGECDLGWTQHEIVSRRGSERQVGGDITFSIEVIA